MQTCVINFHAHELFFLVFVANVFTLSFFCPWLYFAAEFWTTIEDSGLEYCAFLPVKQW
jgi:hypothetical protein